MDKVYKHQETEKKWYGIWETNGYFTPGTDPAKKPFTIILPPPNANADLHLGHAMYTVEDILIRYHRMKGDAALWLPGADHAGFETQFVFEKHLAKEGKSRFDYPRDELYKMIWDFVGKNRGNMENQLRRLGFSLDWSRNKFTLDPDIVKVVYGTFKKLYDEGIVYRSNRLVNYCVKDGTSFSDLEVNSLEVEGKLYFIDFPLLKGGFIQIATTRPETILGDAAVMVNPKDKKYKKLVGETVVLPISNRRVPVIADSYVDMKFGTGAVKLTPNHDFNDFEIAKKHNLYFPPIIGFNGKIQNSKTDYDGLKATAARIRMVEEDTRIKDLIKEVKPHKMVVKTCYKCGRTLEPLPLPQWYVKVKPLTEKAIAKVKEKKIKIYPKKFEKIALNWLGDFHDWNISRQIVWGIRIPAWKCTNCTKDDRWIVTDGEKPQECPVCHSTSLEQDTDTFDTWFSSGQWPFATLKTTRTGDFEYFYPTAVMETGYDILPWWVCRMIMLGIYATGEIPFHNVCLHGLVRDSKGQKMSKSKGNVINPLAMADLYGADALRMALIFGAALGNDLAMSEDKIRGMRNFSNKLWNIGRFIKMITDDKEVKHAGGKTGELGKLTGETKIWHSSLTGEMNKVIKSVTRDIEDYNFDSAANTIYHYAWHQFADSILETAKEKLKAENGDSPYIRGLLTGLFRTTLTLLHPFMPFITEEISYQLFGEKNTPLIITSWPVKS